MRGRSRSSPGVDAGLVTVDRPPGAFRGFPSRKDQAVVAALANRVAEIAALPVQEETRSLWRALNSLTPVRPMVLIHELPWHELDHEGELALLSEDGLCRAIEATLRRTIYLWEHMRVDMVVEPEVIVPKVIRSDGFGIKTQKTTAVWDPMSDVVARSFVDQLKTEDDVQGIRTPEITLDQQATRDVEERVCEILQGILPVRSQGWLPDFNQWPAWQVQEDTAASVNGMWPDDNESAGFSAWDIICGWRGAENLLLDLAARPAFMHQIISRLTDAHLGMLDQLEEQGLLGYGQTTINCNGAYTDELPAPGFNPLHPRARDIWTTGSAQILTSASPAMFEEFELPYATLWYGRFGLASYGCCEVLDNKIDLVRRIPNVRKISASPWAKVETTAEQIGRDYVLSRRPNPAFVGGISWSPDVVERDLRDTIQACARYRCPLELTLKDVSTVQYQPQRLWEWADIAMRLVVG